MAGRSNDKRVPQHSQEEVYLEPPFLRPGRARDAVESGCGGSEARVKQNREWCSPFDGGRHSLPRTHETPTARQALPVAGDARDLRSRQDREGTLRAGRSQLRAIRLGVPLAAAARSSRGLSLPTRKKKNRIKSRKRK